MLKTCNNCKHVTATRVCEAGETIYHYRDAINECSKFELKNRELGFVPLFAPVAENDIGFLPNFWIDESK